MALPPKKWNAESHEQLLKYIFTQTDIKLDWVHAGKALGCQPRGLQEHVRLLKKAAREEAGMSARETLEKDGAGGETVTPKKRKAATSKTPKTPKTPRRGKAKEEDVQIEQDEESPANELVKAQVEIKEEIVSFDQDDDVFTAW